MVFVTGVAGEGRGALCSREGQENLLFAWTERKGKTGKAHARLWEEEKAI
jgi:hypothetical protein